MLQQNKNKVSCVNNFDYLFDFVNRRNVLGGIMTKIEESKIGTLIFLINKYKTIIIAFIIIILGIIILIISSFIELPASISRLLTTIGTIFIPSGLISLIYEYSLRRTFLKEMQNTMEECMRLQFKSLSEIQELGIKKFHMALPTEVIVKGFANSLKYIKILQTWTPDIVPIEQAFFDATKRGCNIQILHLDPKSPLAEIRASDLGYSDISLVETNINSSIMELARFCDTNKISDNVEIRLYNSTPTFSIYAFDDIAFLGIFWRKTMAISGPQIEIEGSNSYLFQFIEKQFTYIWEEAKPVSIQSLLGSKKDVK